jgi:hypothetical protein
VLAIDQVLAAADTLARRAAAAGVQDNQLAYALTHLKRHQDVAGTLSLLARLETSPFAKRSNQTPRQLAALRREVSESLQRVADWRDAAAIVGWARRLAAYYRPAGGGPPREGQEPRPRRGGGGDRQRR